eukprot:8546120-Pyramimonas_sp.AAC.1
MQLLKSGPPYQATTRPQQHRALHPASSSRRVTCEGIRPKVSSTASTDRYWKGLNGEPWQSSSTTFNNSLRAPLAARALLP